VSGPLVPPGPQPGSNGIGLFTIGVSPIGDIPVFSYWTTVISQYSNSSILTGIIASFQAATDQTQNFNSLYDNVINLPTAQGAGLDVLGRIVGVTRTVQLPLGLNYFGFQQAGAPGFGQAPFFAGQAVTNNYQLPDATFRVLITAKALSNISDGSIPSINNILRTLFPNQGNAYVADGVSSGGANMTMAYVFNFPLTPVQLAIVQQSGVLPKSVGVGLSVLVNQHPRFTLDTSVLGGSDTLG
jgi:hypothetical protein